MKALILFVLIFSVCASAELVYMDDVDFAEQNYFMTPTLMDTDTGQYINIAGERWIDHIETMWMTNFFGTTPGSFDGVPGNYLYDSAQIVLDYYDIEYGTKAFSDFVGFYTSMLIYIQDTGKIGANEIVGDLLFDNDSDGLVNFVDTDYIPEPASLFLLASGFLIMKRRRH